MVYLSRINLGNKFTLKLQELLKEHNNLRRIPKERQPRDKFRAKKLAYVTGLQQLHGQGQQCNLISSPKRG